MRIERGLREHRKLMAVGLLGLLAGASGCGDASTSESNVAPAAPPPGQSGKDIADAYKKAYGPSGVAKPEMPVAKFKAP
jgi:hypothetical protein